MRVVIVANPRSGRGRAIRLAHDAGAALAAAGIDSTLTPVGPEHRDADVSGALHGARALLVAGGDGTIASMAPHAIASGVPMYHLPTGNENLFAREHGHSRHLDVLLAALARLRIAWMDVGMARARGDNGTPPIERPFLLMASLGPDASVIHRLDKVRSRASGHLAYTGPIVDELREPHFPKLKVWIDGEVVLSGARGSLIVANSRQYAMRVDPAAPALVDDGLLDVVFMPSETPAEWIAWAIRSLTRSHLSSGSDAWHAQGQTVRVESIGDTAPVQIDGESLGVGPSRRLDVSVRPGVLPVLRVV